MVKHLRLAKINENRENFHPQMFWRIQYLNYRRARFINKRVLMIISRVRRHGKQVSISSFNIYIEMAAPLDRLIFDAVYGSWILSLLLFTLV